MVPVYCPGVNHKISLIKEVTLRQLIAFRRVIFLAYYFSIFISEISKKKNDPSPQYHNLHENKAKSLRSINKEQLVYIHTELNN